MFPLMISLKLRIIFQDIQCIPTVSRFQRDSIQYFKQRNPRTAEWEKITFSPNEGAEAIYRQVFQKPTGESLTS